MSIFNDLSPTTLLKLAKQGYQVTAETITKVSTSLTATIKAHEWAKEIYDAAKQAAYAAFKKAILDRLVDALIAWINNGGKGAIISNWQAFVTNAENQAAGEFAQAIGAGFLCAPFNLQVQLALAPVQGRFTNETCTLNQIVGNINNFMGSFENGSWLAYQELWYPRNNFYGSVLMGIDAQNQAAFNAKEAATNEATAGKGFLSFKKCTLVQDPNGTLDSNGNAIPAGFVGPNVKYRNDCQITTPGELAANALSKSIIDTPIERVISSNDLSQYLTAIFNAATNKLTKVAIGGIRGLVADATQGARINPVLPCAGLDGAAFTACEASVNAENNLAASYQAGNQSIAANPLDLRNQLGNILTQSIAAQTPYVEALQRLAVCQGLSSVPQLQQEQDLLDTLQLQFQDNQTFIDQLSGNASSTAATTTSQSTTALSPDNLSRLAQSAASAVSAAGNSDSIQSAINDSQNQLYDIQNNVSANLPSVQTQLQSCPNVIATSTPRF